MSRRHFACTLALALLAWAAASAAHAANPQAHGVYRWTDAQGQVHYGDPASAPATRPATHVKIRSWAIQDEAPATGSPGPSDAEPSDAQARQAANACDIARRNQALLSDPGRIVLDDSGKAAMTPEQRAARLSQVEREVTAYCDLLSGAPGSPG